MKLSILLSCSLALSLSGCAFIPFFGKKEPRTAGVYKENLDPDRLVDLVIVKKLTGKKKMMFFDDYTDYLEGYIRGAVMDYDDNPMEGIVVRVTDKGKDLPGFDPGVSDSNGVYRVRFSQPIQKKMVDIRASINYNPPWQQQLDILGAALEPQTKETAFRLYYNRKLGIIGIGEDTPKTIARKVTGSTPLQGQTQGQNKEDKSKKGVDKKLPPPPPASKAPKKSDDLFGGFGDFGN